MAVVIETTLGHLTVDLFLDERPQACLNFLKLCKLKYYNYNLFHTIQHGFIGQTGDPSGAGDGGTSVWGVIEGPRKRFFAGESLPKIRHSEPGLLSMVAMNDNLIGSQFFFTLGPDLTSLDGTHCIIGQVTEGHDVLRLLNEAICDQTHRPYQDVRITHTVILDDPFEDPRGFRAPSRSPSPSAERMANGRIGADEDIDDTVGKSATEVAEMLQEREAKARATILEIVGDLPDAEVAPPENVLFVCKLNPVTSDDDLEIIFSRFGKIVGCEVIRDRVTGDSLQYAFVEFDDRKSCEAAYFKMDNVLIDDRRIHVDFSQSVAKVQWKGKGRGLIYKDGNTSNKLNFDNYKEKGGKSAAGVARDRSRSPRRNDQPKQRNYDGRRDELPQQSGYDGHRSNRNQGGRGAFGGRDNRQHYQRNDSDRMDGKRRQYEGQRRRSRSVERNRRQTDYDDTRADRRERPRSPRRDSNRQDKRRVSRSRSRSRQRDDNRKPLRSDADRMASRDMADRRKRSPSPAVAKTKKRKSSSSSEPEQRKRKSKKSKKTKSKHKKEKKSKSKKKKSKKVSSSSSSSSTDSDSS